MSSNEKREEKWTLNFRDDQCSLIISAMMYIVNCCDQRIKIGGDCDRFTATQVKVLAQEIADQVANTTT